MDVINFENGTDLLGFTGREWKLGTYLRTGEKTGEHYLLIGGKETKIINDELRVFVD